MKILTLDLAKQTGWAVIGDGGKIYSGHVKFDEADFPDLALAYWSWLGDQLQRYRPELVAYEAPVVKHPHATKILVGLSWLTILAAGLAGIPSMAVTNTAVKKHFVGRVYGKKETPYPGTVEAQKRGWSPRSTDEADALAILSYVLHKSHCDGPRAAPARCDPNAVRRPRRDRRPAKA
jgi:Holliday junction resolvasome RuvABC endonuclease subunit